MLHVNIAGIGISEVLLKSLERFAPKYPTMFHRFRQPKIDFDDRRPKRLNKGEAGELLKTANYSEGLAILL
jgi:hypothetical protein